MLDSLETLPPDPILGLSAAFREDKRDHKIDLGVGVYRDAEGQTPVIGAIKEAEKRFLGLEDTKAYIGQVGVEEFNTGITELVLGSAHSALKDDRVRTVMTPGGTGALRLCSELIAEMNPDATVWVGDPTWANHIPVITGAGLKVEKYPYYEKGAPDISFDRMLSTLENAQAGDAVLLHGCCHNPCGADLSREHWQALVEFVNRRNVLPFIDIAYQGFGNGLEEDAYGARLMAEQVPEVLVASSCSKNFGLYRERTGAALSIARSAAHAVAAQSHVAHIARGIYSMPPAHGGFLAGMVMADPALRKQWEYELTAMRNRMNELRSLFVKKMDDKGSPMDFSFIEKQNGMFSFLGISPEQIKALRDDHAIYIVGSSRINIAGINEAKLDQLADALMAVM